MTEGTSWKGHHCKVCYENAIAKVAQRRRQHILEERRKRPAREPEPPPEIPPPPKKAPSRLSRGCVFAKSCALPDGLIDHHRPGGFVPVESLQQYGAYALLGTSSALSSTGTALQWIGGSGTANSLASRLGGSLAAIAPPNVRVLVGVLMPDTTSADSAFYTSEQYAQLSQGNTRARFNMKHLPDGAVNVYGFYTGNKTE